MPVHDAMYTASLAEKVMKILPERHPLYSIFSEVEDMAVESSSLGAQAAVAMFEALKLAQKSSDPQLAKLAAEIYHGNYNAEVA